MLFVLYGKREGMEGKRIRERERAFPWNEAELWKMNVDVTIIIINDEMMMFFGSCFRNSGFVFNKLNKWLKIHITHTYGAAGDPIRIILVVTIYSLIIIIITDSLHNHPTSRQLTRTLPPPYLTYILFDRHSLPLLI